MKVKGNTLKARMAFVKERFGAEKWEKVMATLRPEDQNLLRDSVVNVGWYDFALGERLDRAIATVIGWYKEALAMLGATGVVILEETCRARGGEACRYRVSWK